MSQSKYKWTRIADGYWELRFSTGKCLASVTLDHETGRWSWYFRVPEEFSTAPTAATAYAKSLETAKNVCDAIVAGFWDDESEQQNVNPGDFRIPFKHGRKWKNPSERTRFEKLIAFQFPPTLLKSYGDWNGGSLEGFLVFDTDVCRQLATSKFFSLCDIDPEEDEFEDSVLTEARRNPHLSTYPIDQLPFIPFAIVHGSIADEEKANPYNVRAILAFERESKEVSILFGPKQRIVPVAESWDQFMKMTILISDD